MEEWMIQMQQWGAEPAAAIARMIDDKELYIKLLKRFVNNRKWEELEAMVEKGQYLEAFEIAHDLKGNTAVLSLNPLNQAVSQIVEDLREEPLERLTEDLEFFLKEIEVFEEIINKI